MTSRGEIEKVVSFYNDGIPSQSPPRSAVVDPAAMALAGRFRERGCRGGATDGKYGLGVPPFPEPAMVLGDFPVGEVRSVPEEL